MLCVVCAVLVEEGVVTIVLGLAELVCVVDGDVLVVVVDELTLVLVLVLVLGLVVLV